MSIERILTEENAMLLRMLREEKIFTDTSIVFPNQGEETQLNLVSWNDRNQYILYINRKSKIKTRYTLQNKAYDSHILLRLDLDNKPHRNPNGEKISGNHLHIFDKTDESGSWAFELSDTNLSIVFPDFDLARILQNGTTPIEQFRLFCELCNTGEIPNITEKPVNDTFAF
ncbi:DUF6978 family protein [Veillonella caviae]|uniref:DUF6978 family protein n=1 Tax=Veillonella caviae TaxID=248316 RepID=UPI002353FD6D|nr:hypothetical protein [Veillonella caviae]